MLSFRRARFLVLPLLLSPAACASHAQAPPPAHAPPAVAAKVTPAGPVAAPGHLLRAAVEDVMRQGPPWILRRVPVEEVMREGDGRFMGWRLVGLPADWSDLELKPGDVVTRINGKPLETQDAAFEAWLDVARSKELRVSYERGGTKHDLVMPIDGEPTPELVRALQNGTPPPRAANTVRQGHVVTIAPDDRLERTEEPTE